MVTKRAKMVHEFLHPLEDFSSGTLSVCQLKQRFMASEKKGEAGISVDKIYNHHLFIRVFNMGEIINW